MPALFELMRAWPSTVALSSLNQISPPASASSFSPARTSALWVKDPLVIRITRICPTWLQTIQFARNGEEPSATELDAWLDFVRGELEAGTRLAGVLLYGLARKSYQPEAAELSPLPLAWLEAFADRIRGLGLEVRVSP